MAALLLDGAPGAQGGRFYVIEESHDGKSWVLTLMADGEAVGGGRFERVDDGTGFDAGYEDAIDQGEAWL